MNVSKRGDHLFATGFSKTLGDVAVMLSDEIGGTSEGRRLEAAVSRCSRLLTGGVFDAVIDKGRPVTGPDAHSLQFGEASQAFLRQMRTLVFALQFRRGIEGGDAAARGADLALANRQLATAKHAAILETGRFIDAVTDPAVAARLVATGLRGEIEAARAALEQVRQALCACIARV
jgi:hypothetical protein